MIDVTDHQTGWNAWSQALADEARDRYQSRALRLDRDKRDNDERLAKKATTKLAAINAESPSSDAEKKEQERKRAIIAAAMERAAKAKSQL
jgi:electron transport complex protein RnfB